MADKLGDRLARERIKKKLTMQQVAEHLGVARPTYSGYESGYREPDADTLSRLAELYGVTTDYLISGKSLGEVIRSARRNMGLSISQMADATGVSESQLIAQEDDPRPLLNPYEFRLIGDVLGVEVHDMFERASYIFIDSWEDGEPETGGNTGEAASPQASAEAEFLKWVEENLESSFFYDFSKSPEESKQQMMETLKFLWEQEKKRHKD